MRVKLTDRFVKSATTNGRKSPIFKDDEAIGFGIQIRETGRKSFTLDYMFEGPTSATLHRRFSRLVDDCGTQTCQTIKGEIDQAPAMVTLERHASNMHLH